MVISRVVILVKMCLGYDTKLSDGKAPEFRGMWNTPLLPLLPGLLRLGVVAPDRFLSMGQIELNCTYAQLGSLK